MEIYIMGSDQRSVRCARVSYGKDTEIDPFKDKKLLRYLYKNKHASPFEHNIIAFKGSKKKWLDILNKIENPSLQIYYSSGYIWFNLRTAINVINLLPEEIILEIKKHFPAIWKIVEKNGNLSDEELKKIPYTKDKVFLIEKVETPAGWIGLVDKLELGTDMDYYTFVVECPLFVARQWQRHRFGSYNEISRRYTDYNIEFYIPSSLRKQSKFNKQASIEEPIEEPYNSKFIKDIKKLTEKSLNLYNTMKEKGVAKEIARGILPQFMKTRYYWTVPRISLDNFISLRTNIHAQKEIRELAEALKELVGYRKTEKKNIL